MKPYHEFIEMPNQLFPVRIFISSASTANSIVVHPHWHDLIEILYFLSGSANQQIGDRLLIAEQGDIIIIGNNEIHSTYSQGDINSEIMVFQFEVDHLLSYGIDLFEKNLIEMLKYHIKYPLPIKSNTKAGKEILECIFNIKDESKKEQLAFQMYIKSSAYKLAGCLLRNYSHNEREDRKTRESERTREVLRDTFKLIENSFSQELTLQMAAQASNVSVSHFCRLFKSATGMTFKYYLNLYRVNQAEKMLSSLSVTETSYECGFSDVTSFIRTFKRFKNCTPSSLR